MPQSSRELIVRAGDEVRGTQSFVQVMASVWRRPSLVGLEVLWRWAIGLFVIGVIALTNPETWQHRVDPQYWHGLGEAISHGAFTFEPTIAGLSLLIVTVLVWAAVSGVARDHMLRRLDTGLHRRLDTGVVLAMMRVSAFAVLVAAWEWALETIWLHLARASDPDYVLGFAVLVLVTLLLFVFWTLVGWIFPLASILAMTRSLGAGAALQAAWRSGAVRSKLIEINLVMGVVKIALVVLAMVFSATPLPFQAFTTQGFLWIWWIGVALLYLLASDFFHVVRLAACLALCRAYDAR